ncbi:cation transporter [Massilia sp. H-1]|nr:cation transporter [Massilia sp. H-1]
MPSQDDCAAVFSLEGIRCAACVWLIERRLARVPGIAAAEVNVATERLNVRWDGAVCKPSDIVAALRATGYVAYPYDAARHGAGRDKARKTLFRQLFVA